MIILLFLFFPIFSIFIIFLISSRFKNILFYFGIFSLLFQILIFIYFISTKNLPFNYSIPWIKFFNINFSIYIDNLSALLIILNLILYITSFIFSLQEIKENVKEFLIWSFLTLIAINGIFLSSDLFLFYIFFGFLPIPLFFMVKELEDRAYKLLIYLLTGSSFLITGILICVFYFKNLNGFFSFDIFEISKISLPRNLEKIIFFLFILPFLINIPILPFPKFFFEIIANSSTFCSILLSGIISKIGVYGIKRIVFQIFPYFSRGISDFIIILAIFNMIYSSLILWNQKDLKKIFSYLNLFYMGLITAGIFTFQEEGFVGSIFQIFNHGITMGALFIISGLIYKREKTFKIEKIVYFINKSHLLSIIFTISLFSAIFLPGLNNFAGTILIFYSILKKSIFLFIISILGAILIIFYFLFFLIKSLFIKYEERKMEDFNLNEMIPIIILIFLIIYLGIYPQNLILWR